jgi:hypothetical protein
MMLDEQDYVTDDEIDEMYGDGRHTPQPQAMQQQVMPQAAAQPMGNINGLPVYPLALAQAPSLPIVGGGDNLLTRKVGPLPVWGWALTALGTGIGGYFWWQSSKKVSKNDSEDEPQGLPALPSSTGEGRGSWSPSRGVFADQLNKLFQRKGMTEKIKVYDDADEAKATGTLKHLSPLINIKCEVAYKPDKEMERLCKREGLSPIVHEDGTIGLYPASSKRGREWEKYIDLLRDDGQKV